MQAIENAAQDFTPALELGMQELEAMEAPGFWSVTGYVSGAGVSGAVTYSVVATVLT
ncbi:daptide-type RiPP [Streptomyces sp. cg35]|uniref:daptide-type RiPP n=1 Tax=Streptomyces sp. cg35 TaxID=3421650 RepID=UPI003D17A64C